MRVSAVGWLYDSMERTREVARATANVTHNHPEGIKGAESTASAIYMARNGSSKEEIKTYIEREFHYDLSRTLDNIRTYYHHVESCQETVPEAIIAFLESKDLRMPYGMQYHLVEIRIRLVLLQEVLQKHLWDPSCADCRV